MKQFSTVVAFSALMLLATGGCSRRTSSPAAPGPASLSWLPVEMTVRQRSTTIVPGSDGALRLTIDDVTRGQVIVSLVGKDGDTVLAITSLQPGESATFKLGDERYQLALTDLNNVLVGDDSATFEISAGSAQQTTELEKIERLLSLVESAEGLVFIRNGAEHNGKEAADHQSSRPAH